MAARDVDPGVRLSTRGAAPPLGRAFVAALLLAAVAPALAVLVLGPGETWDGDFAIAAMSAFDGADGWPPRWSPSGNAGLGAATFFFYPPGAFLTASAFTETGLAAPATAIALATGAARLAAIGTCALWLRRLLGLRAALAGGALYTLMPYVAVVNPMLRGAFAETLVSPVLPLFCLALDFGRERGSRPRLDPELDPGLDPELARSLRRGLAGSSATRIALAVAGPTALTGFVHLPTLVLAGGLVPLYAVFAGRTWREARSGVVGAVAGLALGLAIDGVTLLPSQWLLGEINAANWAMLTPDDNFLFDTAPWRVEDASAAWSHWGLLAALALALLRGAAAWRAGGWRRACLLTLAATALLATRISAPLWWADLPLRQVQFPGRLVAFASLFGAALGAAALTADGAARARVRAAILLAGLVASGGAVALAIGRGEPARTGPERTDAALAAADAYPLEYFPPRAWLGWDAARSAGAAGLRARAEALSGCPTRRGLPITRATDHVTVDVSGCVGPTVLPQFWFPGWVADGVRGQLGPDPDTGLVRLDVPAGTSTLVLSRRTLPVEWAGRLCSAGGLAVWCAVALARRRRRAAARADPDAACEGAPTDDALTTPMTTPVATPMATVAATAPAGP